MTRARWFCSTALAIVLASVVALLAQDPAPLHLVVRSNANMLGGEQTLTLSPFRVRGDVLGRAQNEPSCAISTRNPAHVLCAANDYRLVDVPGVTTTILARDAWQGLLQSVDGGNTWESTLHPGHFLDPAPNPLKTMGFRAAADPIVRAGVAGMAWSGGIAFTGQTDKDQGTIFVSTFIDLNNREKDRMPFKFVRTVTFDKGNSGQFIDKPWLFVEAAPGKTCTFDVPLPEGGVIAQTVPASTIHAVYSIFVGSTDVRTKIMYTRSTDCGATFSQPVKINDSNEGNQGATIARSIGNNGLMYAAWRRARRVGTNGALLIGDAIIAITSADDGLTWSKAVTIDTCAFDQNTSPTTFRTTAFPTLTVDASGRAYMAWSERPGRLADGSCDWTSKARVKVATSTDGVNWSVSQAIPSLGDEHQIFPSLAFTAGRIFLAWVDFRDDASQIFRPQVDEKDVLLNRPYIRHTGDIFAAMANPGATPNFSAESTKVSRYLRGVIPGSSSRVTLQFNAVNKRWARKGTVPFDGDYIDIATLPYLAPNWAPNTASAVNVPGQTAPVAVTPHLLITWTDNRDMRRVPNESAGDAVPYSVPAGLDGVLLSSGPSIVDPTQTRTVCAPGATYKAGATNQNTYAAPLTLGFVASSPGNNKDLGTVPRAFVVLVRNTTGVLKAYRLRINPVPGAIASFDQFALKTTIPILFVPRYSSVARTVFVSRDPSSSASLDPNATIRVDVDELAGATVDQTMSVFLNSDPSAPEIDSPEIDSKEIYTPEIDSPEIDSPEIDSHGFTAPEIDSPEIDSPEIDSAELLSLGLQGPEIDSPEIDSPEIDSPEIDSPEIDSPSLKSTAVTDVTFKIKNTGNTTAEYAAKAFIKDAAAHGVNYQVIVRRQYFVSGVNDACQKATIPLSDVAVNLLQPEIDSPEIDSPEIDSSALGTATFSVAPDETVDFVIRTRTATQLTSTQLQELIDSLDVAVQQEAVNTVDAAQGITEPPIFTTWLSIATTALPAGRVGTPYSYSLVSSGQEGTPTWNLAGGSSMPPGLSLASSGVISGTPSTAGTFTFTVAVHDSANPSDVATRTLSIAITAAATASVAFVTEPAGAIANQPISPAISVRVIDNTGAVLPGVLVTVALTTNPTGATLSGTTTRSTGATGIATFGDLKLNRGGWGFRLTATAAGFALSTSAPFNIEGYAPTSNMTTPRFRATPVRLANGKVLITGGYSTITPTITFLSSAELYDPVTGTFTGAASLGGPRTDHSATLLPNGKVLIAGGYSGIGTAAAPSALLYDPALGTFASTGAMNVPRGEHTATLLSNGKVLIAGGRVAPSGISASAELYDPATGTFSVTGSLTTARFDHSAAVLPDGKVLIAAGSSGLGTSSAEIYDPVTGTFSPTGALQVARVGHTATTLPNGKVLIAGGLYSAPMIDDPLSSAELFDQLTGTFSSAGSMTVPRQGHKAVLLPDNTVLLSGGLTAFTAMGDSIRTATADIYNPTNGSFRASGDMAAQRSRHVATLLPNGTVLHAGGAGSSDAVLNSAEIFYPLHPPGADLVITTSTLGATPPSVAAGEDVQVSTFTLVNQGTTLAPPFRIGYYLSTDATITSSDVFLGSALSGPRSPGAPVSYGAKTVTIPLTTVDGTYYVGVLLDDLDAVAESNETNNFKSVAITVTGVVIP